MPPENAACHTTACRLDISKATDALFPPTIQPGSPLPQCKGVLLPPTKKGLTRSFLGPSLWDIRIPATPAESAVGRWVRSLPPAPRVMDLLQEALLQLSSAKARPSPRQLGLTRSWSLDGKKEGKPQAFTRLWLRKDFKPTTAHVAHAPCAMPTCSHLHSCLPSSSSARGLISRVVDPWSCTPLKG